MRNWFYPQEIAKSYNKRVRIRTFQQGDWVLWRTFDNKKDKSAGKLATGWEIPYKIIEVRGAGAYRLQDSDGKTQPNCWMPCTSKPIILKYDFWIMFCTALLILYKHFGFLLRLILNVFGLILSNKIWVLTRGAAGTPTYLKGQPSWIKSKMTSDPGKPFT